MEVRFKSGDIVRLKYQKNTKFFIVESTVQTCYAGVQQVSYTGRLFYNKSHNYIESKTSVFNELKSFSAIELEEIPDNSESEDWLEFKKKRNKFKAEKEAAIKDQDFEKAAKFLDEERKARDMMKLFEEVD